jgi:membrane associated rhomboid family serine protease
MTPTNSKKQPFFNHIPVIILIILAGLAGIYSIRFIEDAWVKPVLETFALVKVHNEPISPYHFLTYAFVHLDLLHLIFNSVWLLIFGVPLVKYFSVPSFLMILSAGIIIGGFISIHLVPELTPIIGISAGVSALMGASLRFMMHKQLDFRGIPMLLKISDFKYLGIMAVVVMFDFINALLMHSLYEQNILWQAHFIGLFTGALLMNVSFVNKKAIYIS